MLTDKQKVLDDASEALNNPDQPWEVTVEGDSIIARWKWQDERFFVLGSATTEVRDYTYKVTLDNKGKFKDVEKLVREVSGGGSFKSKTTIGKTWNWSTPSEFKRNNQTGQTVELNTSSLKQSIKAYLESCGWKYDGMLFMHGLRIFDNKRSRIILRLVYSVFLLAACMLLYSFFQDMQFARGDLYRWLDETATVTESKMTEESLILKSEKKDNKTTYYKEYTVRYIYSGEFTAWGRLFSYEYEGMNRGKVDRNAEEIPHYAYNYPKAGDTVAVIYDPDEVGSYRIGSTEEWKKKGELSLFNPNLLLPCIFFLIVLVLIFIDVTDSKKRRLCC